MGLGAIVGLGLGTPSLAHQPAGQADGPLVRCATSGFLSRERLAALDPSMVGTAMFRELEASGLWRNVIAHLLVNLDRTDPCFGISDTETWTEVVSKIPADVLAVQAPEDQDSVLVYVSGIPDYLIETPKVFASFKPGETYGIYRISAVPTVDDRQVHDFASKGAIGIFVNGVSMFNYTDTFSYGDTGVWSFDANVAEAPIVNGDVAHATPSNLPQFPKSRGIFHNHQMSVELLEELQDPYFLGELAHSRLVGFAIDSTPVYGPLGHAGADPSSALKLLRSSYVKRTWLTPEQQGSGHRSSLPGWAVAGWDGSNEDGAQLLNLFQKPKSEILYADGSADGPVRYSGADDRLAAEIELLDRTVGLKRDRQGYVYWEGTVHNSEGRGATVRNYLLKTSELWGPGFDEKILPASYQIADIDKFYFKAVPGSFAEDYDYVAGYGDLDFYNGIDSYLPDRGASAYHYVATFSADWTDEARLASASFPYFVGIQYKHRPDPFNHSTDSAARSAYFADSKVDLTTVFDLGIVGRDEQGAWVAGPVPARWQEAIDGE